MPAIPAPAEPGFSAYGDTGLLSHVTELDDLESGWVVLTDCRLANVERLHREVCACPATTPAGVLSREAMRRQCYYDGPGAPELVAAFARDVGEIWGVHIGLRAVTKEAKAA